MLQTRSSNFTALGLGCNWWLFFKSSCCIWSGVWLCVCIYLLTAKAHWFHFASYHSPEGLSFKSLSRYREMNKWVWQVTLSPVWIQIGMNVRRILSYSLLWSHLYVSETVTTLKWYHRRKLLLLGFFLRGYKVLAVYYLAIGRYILQNTRLDVSQIWSVLIAYKFKCLKFRALWKVLLSNYSYETIWIFGQTVFEASSFVYL